MSNLDKLQQYKDLIDKHKKHLLSLPNVHGVSIGKEMVNGVETGNIAVIAHVYKKINKSRLGDIDLFENVISGIDPTIVSDVQEKELPHLEYLSVPKEQVNVVEDNAKYRPLLGGCRIANESDTHYHFGTGGFIALSTSSVDQKCIMTNYHVIRKSMDNKVYQPSVTVDNYIGTVGNTAWSAQVDGAQIKLNSGINTENKIIEIGAVAGTQAPALNDAVQKYGATTRLTAGVITNINYAGTVEDREFEKQIIISKKTSSDPRLSDDGDSGSAWVITDNNKITALHWGGNSSGTEAYASPIAAVQIELGVTVAVD